MTALTTATEQTTMTDGPSPFRRDEWHRLWTMRIRYQYNPDLFTEREMARLRFMRWLHRARRLEPQGGRQGCAGQEGSQA
jgi:hypothetical protein